jgi:NAD(P)-dependent dehydrogenase (short-subunit alcohol dehydrogenase family)
MIHMTAPLAVVTGAASGIGLALTHELVARAIDVIAIDKAGMPFHGIPAVTPVQLDISDADAMQQLAASFAGRPLDYLFANAGIGAPGSVFGAAPDDWQRAWAVNTMGPLNTLRSWWPHLAQARGKAVVTVSVAALLSYPGAALYRATKAALLSMLESLYYEIRESGVMLHALCPGMVQSRIIENARPPGAPAPIDPFSLYLQEAMRNAEPAQAFAQRVLDGLADNPPFYWLTHERSLPALEARQRGIAEGHPTLDFSEMP